MSLEVRAEYPAYGIRLCVNLFLPYPNDTCNYGATCITVQSVCGAVLPIRQLVILAQCAGVCLSMSSNQSLLVETSEEDSFLAVVRHIADLLNEGQVRCWSCEKLLEWAFQSFAGCLLASLL